MHENILNNDNNHFLKNSYQLAENINKLKNFTSIVTDYFKDLFNNINLQNLIISINSVSGLLHSIATS